MIFALIFVLLLTFPIVAWADPVSFVAWAVSALGTAVGGVVGATLIMYAVPIAVGLVLAAGLSISNRARNKARDAAFKNLRDRIVTVRGSTEYRRMILGRQPVGGVVAFIGSVGQFKEQLVMVIALAGHEIDAVEEIWLEDTKLVLGGQNGEYAQNNPYARSDIQVLDLPFVGNGSTTTYELPHPPIGSVTATISTGSGQDAQTTILSTTVSGQTVTFAVAPANGVTVIISYQAAVLTSFVRVRSFLGAPGQTVDSVVQSLFPTEWDATHPMTGCAGLAIHFYYSEDAFPSGLPNIMAVCRGAKVYDVRKDSTAGGSGLHRINDSATWEWSENPALLISHYAMSPLGGRLPIGSVNQSYTATAANKCDTQVDYSSWATLTVPGEGGGPLTDNDGDPIRVSIPRPIDWSV